MVTRFTRGRTREDAYASGGDLRFQELALATGAHDGLDRRFKPLATTSLALRGADLPERDEPAMTSPYGDSKAHRPDVKHAVRERLVSPEGGVPFVSTRGEGHTAALQGFQERAQGLLTAWHKAPSPRSVSADATRAHAAKAPTRHALGFMPRRPNTIGVVSQVITRALTWERWHGLEETTRDQGVELGHAGRAQRGLVVLSQAARERAEAPVPNARQRAAETLETPRVPLQAQRCSTPEAAHQALARLAKAWNEHQREARRLIEHNR